jgi:CelD/BcsL family acetyltransferase involved in cellulose biosynthesis
VQISVARPSELSPDEVAGWRRLQRQNHGLSSPCLCPEFAIAVDAVRDDARVAVLSDGPEIVGFFPFQRRRLGVGVPIGAALSACQGVIHAPGTEWCWRELLRRCRLSAWQFDCLIDSQRPPGATASVVPSPVIDLGGGFAAYQAKLGAMDPRFMKNLTRNKRLLEEEAGPLRMQVGTPDPAALRLLMRWKSDQYRRTGWIDAFDRPWLVELVYILFGTNTGAFGGQLSVSYARDTPVAATFDLRFGHALAGLFSAYGPRFAKRSPGLIHIMQTCEANAERGIRIIDLGKGTEKYKQVLKTDDVFLAQGIVSRGPVLDAAHRARTGALNWAGPTVRRHPRVFHVADRLLRHYGRTT